MKSEDICISNDETSIASNMEFIEYKWVYSGYLPTIYYEDTLRIDYYYIIIFYIIDRGLSNNVENMIIKRTLKFFDVRHH